MGKITNEMIHESYELGKKYYNQDLQEKDGIDKLVSIGVNPASASFLLSMYKWHVDVTEYKKSMNAYGTEYYLKRIYEEHGIQGLETALRSLKLNLVYYESFGKGKRTSGWKIYNKYLEIAKSDNSIFLSPEEEIGPEEHREGKVVQVSVN